MKAIFLNHDQKKIFPMGQPNSIRTSTSPPYAFFGAAIGEAPARPVQKTELKITTSTQPAPILEQKQEVRPHQVFFGMVLVLSTVFLFYTLEQMITRNVHLDRGPKKER